MYKHNDLNGRSFGRLKVINEHGRTKDRHILWECRCECGNIIDVSSRDLMTGHTMSCGCLQKHKTSIAHYKHGGKGTRLYSVWNSMKKRCENSKCKSYKWYGAKGVTVCPEWQDYNNFKKWAMSSGYDKDAEFGKCTIDRIDPCGNYEPSNCRWVTMAEQAKNKRASA